MAVMPAQKPGRSRQDWCTPPELLNAVRKRLDINDFLYDLAASADNVVNGGPFFSEEDNALTKDWNPRWLWDDQYYAPDTLWCWLNPPYSDIKPWVEKASTESAKGAHVAMLVPASTGSNWWRDWVIDSAYVLFLNGRVTFVGAEGPYPKDCALLLYTPFIRSGSAVWDWRSNAQGV